MPSYTLHLTYWHLVHLMCLEPLWTNYNMCEYVIRCSPSNIMAFTPPDVSGDMLELALFDRIWWVHLAAWHVEM